MDYMDKRTGSRFGIQCQTTNGIYRMTLQSLLNP